MNKSGNNIEISDEVSVLLVVYWLKEKPSNWGLSYRLDIIATGNVIRSPYFPVPYQVKFFWLFVEKFWNLSSDKVIETRLFNKILETLDFAGN